MNKSFDNNEMSLVRQYLKDIEKYPLISYEELLEEYKNITKKDEILILTEGKLDIDKLFSMISSKEDLLLVTTFIKDTTTNKYPLTIEDKKLINKLTNYKENYKKTNTNLNNQLQMYIKYKKSIDKIINSNLRLVISIAKKYKCNIELLDLISAGNEGLVVAATKYKPEMQTQFSTYATWWIKSYINRFITNTSSLIRIPEHIIIRNQKIRKLLKELNLENEKYLTKKELAKKLGVKEEEIEDYYNSLLTGSILSTSQEINEDGDTFETIIKDEKDPYEKIFDENKEIIKKLFELLNEREKLIVKKRNGIDCEPQNLKEIANKLNISIQRVRKIETDSYRKMKNKAYKINR